MKLINSIYDYPVPVAALKLDAPSSAQVFGSAEKHDAVIKLLSFSKRTGMYVGVSWAAIMSLKFEELQRRMDENKLAPELLGSEVQSYINAFSELMDEGLIRKERHQNKSYLFPLPAMIKRLV